MSKPIHNSSQQSAINFRSIILARYILDHFHRTLHRTIHNFAEKYVLIKHGEYLESIQMENAFTLILLKEFMFYFRKRAVQRVSVTSWSPSATAIMDVLLEKGLQDARPAFQVSFFN